MNVKILKSPMGLAYAAATHFVEQGQKSVQQSGGFMVALSGGSTPKLLYELLANPQEPFRQQIAWDKTYFYFTDERHVPPDHPESNYRMAHEAMLSHVPVPKKNVHRVLAEKRIAAEAAEEYEDVLAELFAADVPDLDLVLLGLGTDGHTASIFPNSEVLHEIERLVAAPWVEKLNSYRITLTLPVLNNAASVVFLVTGEEKAAILSDVIKTDPNPERYPAQAIRPIRGELLWLVDEAAAKFIK